jgi:hypothetical protein
MLNWLLCNQVAPGLLVLRIQPASLQRLLHVLVSAAHILSPFLEDDCYLEFYVWPFGLQAFHPELIADFLKRHDVRLKDSDARFRARAVL